MEERPEQPTLSLDPLWPFQGGFRVAIGLKSDTENSWLFEILSSRVYAVGIKFLSFETKEFQFESSTVTLEDSLKVYLETRGEKFR